MTKHFERFLNVSNGGETTNFYTCQTCFASVQPGDREGHDEWHRKLDRIIKKNQDGTRRR